MKKKSHFFSFNGERTILTVWLSFQQEQKKQRRNSIEIRTGKDSVIWKIPISHVLRENRFPRVYFLKGHRL